MFAQSIQGGAAGLAHRNRVLTRFGHRAPAGKILNVDLLQTVDALARKTCYPENAYMCQLVFC